MSDYDEFIAEPPQYDDSESEESEESDDDIEDYMYLDELMMEINNFSSLLEQHQENLETVLDALMEQRLRARILEAMYRLCFRMIVAVFLLLARYHTGNLMRLEFNLDRVQMVFVRVFTSIVLRLINDFRARDYQHLFVHALFAGVFAFASLMFFTLACLQWQH